jgi:Ni,Fe-hydrogenase III small subunit
MITDVMFRSLRSRSRLISVEELINGCDGSRMPEVVPESLTVPIALKLADVCPTQAITTESRNSGSFALHLDYGECIGCGRCIDAGEGVIRPARTLSRCGVPREALVRTWLIGSAVSEEEGVTPEAALGEFHTLLGRALNIRQLDPGSCNGCEAEITALANPYYDLERFGIHFVASPKHADMLLVTGPITRNMATAVRRTYEAVPAPKLVVAVGACGCSAGVFDSSTQRSSSIGTQPGFNEEIVGPVDSVLPVDGYIPGCPPTPAMLVSGVLRVLRRSCK